MVKFAHKQGVNSLLLCDTNFHATVKFIEECQKYKITPIISYLYNDKIYYAKNTEELYELFNAYNTNNFSSLKLNYIDKDDVYLAYYFPGKRRIYELFCNVLGVKCVEKGVLKNIYCNLEAYGYKLKSFQTLPTAPKNFIDVNKIKNNVYKERLIRELEIIKEKNFLDYFHTVYKITKIAKEHDIAIGPGRGSAVGSLLSYMLGITKIDPIKHNLLFERFLNKGRKEPPDIDLDVEDEKRKELIELLKKEFKYVYYISTFSNIGPKTIKKIANEYKISTSELSDLLGLPTHKSVHAAGIIISKTPIKVPIKEDVIEWDMDSLNKIGYIKFDILGLKTLTIMNKLEKKIGKPKLDKITFNFISKGYTNGIFQLESNISKRIIRAIKPSSIDELSIVISLNRPGPLKAKLDRELAIAKWKQRKKSFELLNDTFGIIVFQEQIMLIAKKYANFSNEEADVLRKGIAKKEKKLVEPLIKKLKKNILNILSENETNELIKIILEFSEYAFNKSHAIAYSYISYSLAYFKKHFPKDFYSTLLKYDTTKIEKIIFEMQSRGFKILPPNINGNPENKKEFHIPLTLVKGINEKIEKEIIANAPYNSLKGFFEKNPNINFSIVESLIKIGSFDYLSESRRKLLMKLKEIRSGVNEKILELSSSLFGKNFSNEIKIEKLWERCDMEYNTLGFCISKPFDEFKNLLSPLSVALSREQKLAINVKAVGGYVSDGVTTIKLNVPDGVYTIINDKEIKIFPGIKKAIYVIDQLPSKLFIEKGNENEFVEIVDKKLKIKSARPVFDDYKILIEGESDVC
nr:DNA polymerase III subunit alpha [Thermosipho melanesiensis]